MPVALVASRASPSQGRESLPDSLSASSASAATAGGTRAKN